VDEGNGKFNLMLLCWGEGHSSAVHDHADAHCFMKMLDGNLREVRFAWPSDSNSNTGSPATESVVGADAQELQPIGSSLLEVNGVCYINGNYILF
jgi:cysteine dioxygenase